MKNNPQDGYWDGRMSSRLNVLFLVVPLVCLTSFLPDVTASKLLYAGELPNVSFQASISHRVIRGLPCVVALNVTSLMSEGDVSLEDVANLSEAERVQRLENIYISELAFPRFEFFATEVPLELEIRDATGAQIESAHRMSSRAFFSIDPDRLNPPVSPGQVRKPFLSLRPAESQSLVIDIWPWLRKLSPGDYTITFLLYSDTTAAPWRSESLQISFEETTTNVLSTVAGAIPSFGQKGFELPVEEWIDPENDVARLQDELPEDVFESVALHAFLSVVARNGTVDGAPVEILDSLPANLSPLGEAIRFEVQRPGLTEEEAQQLTDQIASSFPGIGWRLDEVEQGRGLLRRVIGLSTN